MKIHTSLLSCIVVFCACSIESCAVQAEPRLAPRLVPQPASLAMTSGEFILTKKTVIHRADHNDRVNWIANDFASLVRKSTGFTLREDGASFSAKATPLLNQINFIWNSTIDAAQPDDESYDLEVTPATVTISANSEAGLFYGAMTLWQMISENRTIPGLKISDRPRFSWRGMHLDSARHFQSVAFIKNLIDVLAVHKINTLQWHLTDDQGWRIEIKKYPRLTQVGAKRFENGPNRKPYGEFYTQKQIRELVAYAENRHITIVPEIEMPGHASAAIAAYPELGAQAKPLAGVPSTWGVLPNLFNVNDATFAFLEDVLTETMALFPSKWIHVGGDEAIKPQWKASPSVQAKMRELKITDEDALQSWFIARIGKFIDSRGRRLVGWDEILQGGLAPNATVMSWQGIEGAVKAAKLGHDAVVSAWPTLYFDSRQTGADTDPGREKIVTLKDVYQSQIMPTNLTPAEQNHIIGVQGQVWTEYIDTDDDVARMAFPRELAVAELGWTQAKDLNWNRFLATLPIEKKRFHDLNFLISDVSPDLVATTKPSGLTRNSHQLECCTHKEIFSLKGDARTDGTNPVYLFDGKDPCWKFKNANLTGVTSISATVGQVRNSVELTDEERAAFKFPPTRAAGGELQVFADTCDGELIATLPLGIKRDVPNSKKIKSESLKPLNGQHDLCLRFSQSPTDSHLWVIDEIGLNGPSSR